MTQQNAKAGIWLAIVAMFVFAMQDTSYLFNRRFSATYIYLIVKTLTLSSHNFRTVWLTVNSLWFIS